MGRLEMALKSTICSRFLAPRARITRLVADFWVQELAVRLIFEAEIDTKSILQ
jgi:hypothetical protein